MTMMTTRTIPADVAHYLALHHVITVSTPSFTGMPHADTVVYVHDDSSIYFTVVGGSTLARNIRDSRFVSFTIDDYLPDWHKLRELQGVGRGELVEPSRIDAVMELVAAKFGASFTPPPGRLHRLTPIEMHFVHYEDGTVSRSGGTPATAATMSSTPGWGGAQGPVATSLDRLVVEPGEVVFRSSDRTGQFYVVVDGLVEVRREGFGADQTVTRVRPGQMFGEHAATDQHGVLTAHAVERTVLLVVEPGAVRDLAVIRPD